MTPVLALAREAPRRLPMLAVRDYGLAGFRSETPLAPEELSPGERRFYDRIGAERRRVEWLTGRSALKAAAVEAGLSVDTSDLKLPHPQLSLTHCAGTAIAVCAADRSVQARGTGVDFERDCRMSREMLRLFATDEELASLGSSTNATILRLWTIKEAAFKACPDNGGMVLNDVVIGHLTSSGCGEAVLRARHHRIFFSTYRYNGGWLSLALSLEA